MKYAVASIFLWIIVIAYAVFVHPPRLLPAPPAPPCDCESRIADLDRRCTDAMARQVGLLRSCEMRCPQEEPTP